ASGSGNPSLLTSPRLAAGQRVEFVENIHAPEARPAAGGRTAYRVVQEALTNARKHAPGRPVQVRLEGRPGERLTIDVRNRLAAPGSTGSATPGTGTGLIGLGERVHLTGGRLDHEIAEDEFRLHVELPWPA